MVVYIEKFAFVIFVAGGEEKIQLLLELIPNKSFGLVQYIQIQPLINALLIEAMGLHLCDVIMRFAVSLCLGVPLCRPYKCLNVELRLEFIGFTD